MSDKVQKFIDENEDIFARVDMLFESDEEIPGEIDELLKELDRRDEDIFAAVGADPEDTIDDYEDVPRDDRGPGWAVGLSALFAAARLQVWARRKDQLVRLMARRARLLSNHGASGDDLASTLGVGVSKAKIKAAKASITAIEDQQDIDLGSIPSASKLMSASDAEFIEILEDAGILPTYDRVAMASVGDTASMMEIPSGSPEFTGAISSMVDREGRGHMVEMSRRTDSSYSTMVAIGLLGLASTKALCAWLSETDRSTCDKCLARDRDVMSYDDWRKRGLPGAGVCRGGDRCRCLLVPLK